MWGVVEEWIKKKKHFDKMYKKNSTKIRFFRRVKKMFVWKWQIYIIEFYNITLFSIQCNNVNTGIRKKYANASCFTKKKKITLRCNSYTSIRKVLNALQWLSVKQIIVFYTIMFIFKVRNNFMAGYLQRRVITNVHIIWKTAEFKICSFKECLNL